MAISKYFTRPLVQCNRPCSIKYYSTHVLTSIDVCFEISEIGISESNKLITFSIFIPLSFNYGTNIRVIYDKTTILKKIYDYLLLKKSHSFASRKSF